ncbi:MAG: hypothetical protein AAGF47_09310 [Planctomycetota bacterium]
MFDLVIAVDWSAASSPGPPRPSPNRAWTAWGTRQDRPAPIYHRTRSSAIEQLTGLLASHRGTALVGFDFAFGYPTLDGGRSVLPVGRELCRMFGERLEDDANDRNNRFEVAAELNAQLAKSLGTPGPFWGRPAGHDDPRLPATKPKGSAIGDHRAAERYLHARGHRPQSAWKLAYAGSVGSQVITGLAAVHRLMTAPGLADRCRLWPFETDWSRDLGGGSTIVIAEIYPSLADHAAVDHPILDARQVVAQRDEILDANDPEELLAAPHDATGEEIKTAQRAEGWILHPRRLAER